MPRMPSPTTLLRPVLAFSLAHATLLLTLLARALSVLRNPASLLAHVTPRAPRVRSMALLDCFCPRVSRAAAQGARGVRGARGDVACTVCLEGIRVRELVRVLKCRHLFHAYVSGSGLSGLVGVLCADCLRWCCVVVRVSRCVSYGCLREYGGVCGVLTALCYMALFTTREGLVSKSQPMSAVRRLHCPAIPDGRMTPKKRCALAR